MTNYITFHTDPAHGWLEVNRVDLEILNIADKISRFSYSSGTKVFLEEDCDAPHFIRAAESKGWTIETTEKFTNGESFIRRLPSYKEA